MTDLDTLTSLRERVIAAEGPDLDLDVAIWRLEPTQPRGIDFYTASIDAALGLVGRMLPGQHPTIGQNVHHHYWLCTFNKLDDEGAPVSNGSSHAAPTPPLAILAALLGCLIANAKGET